MFKIYMIVNQNNGKLYIGKTSQSILSRWSCHKRWAGYNSDIYFYRAIRKHGPENFTLKQIDCTENEQEANELEKLYIGIFQSYRREIGYNGTMGGEGCSPNEQTRLKISPAYRGKRSVMFGKNHSEETKQKISSALMGHGFSKETLLKMSLAKKGKKQTEDSIKKRSEAMKRAWSDGRMKGFKKKPDNDKN